MSELSTVVSQLSGLPASMLDQRTGQLASQEKQYVALLIAHLAPEQASTLVLGLGFSRGLAESPLAVATESQSASPQKRACGSWSPRTSGIRAMHTCSGSG